MSKLSDKLGDTSGPSIEVSQEPRQVILRTQEIELAAKESLDMLAALALPLVYKYLFPRVFLSIWAWLKTYVHKKRDFSQLAIGLPRGFAKTSVIKLFVLYAILFTDKKFILIIAGTASKAENIIADISGMLSEPNILKVFGNWKLKILSDRQDKKNFSFRGRDIILMGVGAQADIRGITLNNERPDIIIFDDIQTREDADSEQVALKLETWMYGTAMKAKSPEGCLFIFIANMYPTKWSLLRRIKHNPNWIKFITGGILEDGTSLWEDLQPIKQLLVEFQNDYIAGRKEIFFAEVLNDENATVNDRIDLTKLPRCPYEKGDIHQGNYVIVDPATDKSNADAISIGYFELFDEKPVGMEIEEGRFSFKDTGKKCIAMALKNKCYLIVVEANAYQYVLKEEIESQLRDLGIISVYVVPIYSGRAAKNTRILGMFKSLQKGDIYVHHSQMPKVSSQIVPFNPLKTNNTDGILDLLTYAERVPKEYAEFLARTTILDDEESRNIPVLTEADNCAF